MKYLKIFLLLFLSILFYHSEVDANLTISPLKFEFDVDKGVSKKEKIKVTNTGKESITIYSSKEDFIAGDDTGTPKFVKAEEVENPGYTLANWIRVEDQNITLASGESKEVSFSIDVPAGAEPGGHYAAIFFSPGVPNGGQVAVVQRLGVLLLVNVPGEVKIEGNLKSFKIGKTNSGSKLEESNTFDSFPITFQTIFENSGNVHLKPSGKITLIDEDGEVLKNIGKITLTSPAGAYVGEEMVNYIPINDVVGNVLPRSDRRFESTWEGFGYNVLESDGTKSVKFKNLSEYYADKASENAKYLMFWQSINERTVTKKITANFELSYEGKDKEKKEFLDTKEFNVVYKEKYVGLNYYVVGLGILILILAVVYFLVVAPKQKKRREEEIKAKLMEEMKKNNN